MIFPVTGFPVARQVQQKLPGLSFHDGRIGLAGFADGAVLITEIAPSVTELFVAKAAWLSDLLYRILARTDFGLQIGRQTQQQLARYLDVADEKADLALCGLLWLSAANPVLVPLRTCFVQSGGIAHLDFLAVTPAGRRLLALLLRSRASLDAQLEELLTHFPDLLTDAERRLLLQVLYYERTAQAAGGMGPGEPHYGHALPAGGIINRSNDRDWMQSLVLVAKIVPVWLADIRRRYRIDAWRLDQVPAEELEHLRSLGINGIWLVGLWQRSAASARIKSLTGGKNYASAYSVFDYRVADEWGGEAALARFHELCAQHGIRLGCDMVPNHTGIDSRWMREHPEWFLQAEFSPFPNYRFEGENLSGDAAMEIRIEQGYYSRTDAAVVFALDRDGRRRYIYHGNDGTGLPWNDTAQLDHTRADVRQAIIETALSLARYFSVIRFDAAMTLTRDHYRRLWFPSPDEAPAIASRSAHALVQHEFDARMPQEFWLELVEAFRGRSADTLLIAEAFWMTEMYFVRSLGMHRVYNSAFMHALRDEQNGEFMRTLREFREHDHATLMRFVNYLSTPDEESAQAHFPLADKYFGAMVLMATLPGLPMLAPGQTEGYREKYGMDQDAPLRGEPVDEYLVNRHRTQITPLLQRRAEFADPLSLQFPAAEKPDHVILYAAGRPERHIVIFNNSPHPAQVSLLNFSDFFPGGSVLLGWKDLLSGRRYRTERNSLGNGGLKIELEPYASRVYTGFADAAAEYTDTSRRYPQQGQYLSGVAVPVAALRSEHSCGIGEFSDLKLLVDWCCATGQKIINLLPVNDTGYNSSPYSALSAMALHPVYICLEELPLTPALRQEVEAMRRQTVSQARVRFYEIVRFKEHILRRLYETAPEAERHSVPAEFASQPWLHDYALFRVLKELFGGSAWFDWLNASTPPDIATLLRAPTPAARAEFISRHQHLVDYHIWVQYLLDQQLRQVRDYADQRGVYLKGDMPIMLERDSVDVWLNPELFNHHLRAGAPPDMFSPDGQNWGFPVYNWPAHEREDFSWWRARIAQLDRYFAAYRIDHVLGFFRIWSIAQGNRSGLDGFFLPSLSVSAEELQTLAAGEQNAARLARVPLYPHERDALPGPVQAVLSQYDGVAFLPDEYNTETAIESLHVEAELKRELLRRLHSRPFIRFDDRFFPAWEFEQRLSKAESLPADVRERLLAHVHKLKEQEQPIQHEQGRRILTALKQGCGMLPCAEDLGVVPDYVRPALADMGILCLKVYRWEAENNIPKDPAGYPYLSLATSSVHDSSNLREWLASESQQVTGIAVENGQATPQQVSDFLRRLYTSPSMIVMIPLQDLLALDGALHGDAREERINVPGTVSDFNWTYRMPLPLEALLGNQHLAAQVRGLVDARPR
ncbi:MAG: 4-alpha-glucanotransferase [Spirochaetota bacterium]